jgi:hypothetical protein
MNTYVKRDKNGKKIRSTGNGPMSLWSYDPTAAASTIAHDQAAQGYEDMRMTLWRTAGKM